eukprot:14035638-Heterocapsa_arctica.AAC.1
MALVCHRGDHSWDGHEPSDALALPRRNGALAPLARHTPLYTGNRHRCQLCMGPWLSLHRCTDAARSVAFIASAVKGGSVATFCVLVDPMGRLQ